MLHSFRIAFSDVDRSIAQKFFDRLQTYGIRCWLDERQSLPDEGLHLDESYLRPCDKVILCVSRLSLNSWWVDGELNRAFAKEAELTKQRCRKTRALIPLNLDGYLFEWENGKAAEIKSRLAADFTGWETDNAKFETQFERLVRALKTGDAGREPPPVPKL